MLDWVDAHEQPDVIHGNYWLSGVVGHRLKHDLDVPFVSTFHTLARVKAEGGDPEPIWRETAEAEIVQCADAICVSCDEEEQQFRRLYGDPQGRLEIIAPGVEHAFFAPGDRAGARRALGFDLDRPLLLFVGRIQPLKGPDVAVRALAELGRPDAQLVIVGGASGDAGDDEAIRIRALVDELGLTDRVHFVEPQPHHILSTYYRAADVVLVPSRSESFGLVALEAAACGIPVVASAVGGLLSLVDDHVDRPSDRGSRPERVRTGRRRASSTTTGCADRCRPRRSNVPGATRGASPPRACVACTATSPCASGCPAHDRGVRSATARRARATDRRVARRTPRGRTITWWRSTGPPTDTVRWYVRMRGDEKEFTTVWVTLGQRTLRYETYVLPAPEENAVELYENLLRRNERLVGAHFSIGIEDAVFLRGEMPVSLVSLDELDRALGTLYAQVEQCFQGFLRIAFASRFSS